MFSSRPAKALEIEMYIKNSQSSLGSNGEKKLTAFFGIKERVPCGIWRAEGQMGEQGFSDVGWIFLSFGRSSKAVDLLNSLKRRAG